jgi:hypothetical protein
MLSTGRKATLGGTDRTLRNGGQAEKWSDTEMKTFQPVAQFGMWK